MLWVRETISNGKARTYFPADNASGVSEYVGLVPEELILERISIRLIQGEKNDADPKDATRPWCIHARHCFFPKASR